MILATRLATHDMPIGSFAVSARCASDTCALPMPAQSFAGHPVAVSDAARTTHADEE